MGRIAAIDFGLKRIGLAVSDPTKVIASTMGVLQTEKMGELTAKKVLQAFSHYELEALIVGLPLHLSGKKSFLADEVEHFITLLKKETVIPILPFDERLTTSLAERSLRESSLTRKKRSAVVDTVTASILLQSYLEMLSMRQPLMNTPL